MEQWLSMQTKYKRNQGIAGCLNKLRYSNYKCLMEGKTSVSMHGFMLVVFSNALPSYMMHFHEMLAFHTKIVFSSSTLYVLVLHLFASSTAKIKLIYFYCTQARGLTTVAFSDLYKKTHWPRKSTWPCATGLFKAKPKPSLKSWWFQWTKQTHGFLACKQESSVKMGPYWT